MKKSNLLLLSLALLLTLASCSQRLIDFTVISSKNTSFSFDKTQGIRVTGASNGFLGMGTSIKDAMDKALQSAGPDYDLLVDGVVRVNDYFFVSGFTVEGTAISSSKIKKSLGTLGFDNWLKKQNVFEPQEEAKQLQK